MRVIVTGGFGFIGNSIVDKLAKQGYEVAIYDAFLSFIDKPKYYKTALSHRKKIFKNKPHLKIKADIRDRKKLFKAFKDFKPEVVLHLAGLPMARPLKKFESLMTPINLDGTLNVLEAFEKIPSARRIIYTSSSMAYGHFKKTPQPEEEILVPTNAYGATKAAGEYFVKLSTKEWVIVRPTSVYGYTDCANRVSQLLFDAALNNKSAWIVRGETLDFSYVEDVADGFVKCVESPSAMYQTLNISRGEPRTAADFAEIIKKCFPRFKYEIKEPTNQHVWRGALDISKAKKLINFEPKFNIEKGIEEIVNLMKEHKWKELAYQD